MKESPKSITKEAGKAKTAVVGKVEAGSAIRSDSKARFVTGTWNTEVEVATTTMPSKPTFSRGNTSLLECLAVES